MNTLTVPKIKDLVNKPKEQYNELFQTMQHNKKTVNGSKKEEDVKNMTDELSSFLNDLKKNGSGTSAAGSTNVMGSTSAAGANVMGANVMGSTNVMGLENTIGSADQFSGNAFSTF